MSYRFRWGILIQTLNAKEKTGRFWLRSLGTGDGAPCGDRNHSAYLYCLDGANILIDCGESVCRSFKASGLSWDTIDQIILSHFHSDHFGGFFLLMQGMWLEKRRKRLPVAMPQDGLAPFRQMLDLGMIFDELLEFQLTFEALRLGQPVQIGQARVTPYLTTHLEGLRKQFQKAHPLAFEAFCFLLESGPVRAGHSADLGSPTDLAPLLAQPLDLLVCELAHFHPEDLFEYLKDHVVRHLVLTHLGRPQRKRLDEIRRNVARILPGWRVTFAEDQDLIEI